MKNFMKNAKKTITKKVSVAGTNAKEHLNNFAVKMYTAKQNARLVLANNRGDQNVSQAVLILIAIVIGALLLAGLYTLFEDVILPTVTERVEDMFDYAG